eukprot:4262402-Amphidinium_carterae.2
MFYFNTMTRVQRYETPMVGGHGLDECYDCATEMHILSKYIECLSKERNEELRKELLASDPDCGLLVAPNEKDRDSFAMGANSLQGSACTTFFV